jgi:GT2 family glycosyltransferase
MMADISVIIVSYNVRELLLDCLKTVYQNTPASISLEVMVIDNNSSDYSVESVKEKFPQAVIIANKFNAGFSGANNQGMAIAKGKYIFLLNPDTEIVDDAMVQLYSYLSSDNNCAVVAPQLLNSDRTIQLSAWKTHNVSGLVAETFFLHKLFDTTNYPFEQLNTTFNAQTLSGAALFFRKELIDKIGMLDEKLFWMEDVDFCHRAGKLGSLIYLSSAKVLHHSGQSQKKNYNVAISNQLLSKLKFYKKHFSFSKVFLANLSCFIFISTRLLAFAFLSPLKKIYQLKTKAYFYTLKRFLKYIFFNEERIV